MARDLFRAIKPVVIALSMALGGHGYASGLPAEREATRADENSRPSSHHAQVAVATAPGLYSARIGDSRFQVSHLELQNDGYTVESGKLISTLGQEEGALIMVRAADGALTGIVFRDGRAGLLQVSAQGEERFSLEPAHNELKPDSVPGDEQEQVHSSLAPDSAPVYIDVLFGFTQAALAHSRVDPKAFALAQIEAVNLSLRNSDVENVYLRLAGIRVYDEDIHVTPDGLARWQALLRPLRPHYRHDINAGFSFQGDSAGWGYKPGQTSVVAINATTTFLHEVAHNAGGSHCNTEGEDNYKFGYNAADNINTNLCGRTILHYSNPEVSVNGRPTGHARTANMARLWREQALRMALYSVAYNGLRAIYTGDPDLLNLPVPSLTSKPYFVTLDERDGPTRPDSNSQTSARLTVPLTAEDGEVHRVVMHGSCRSPLNIQVPMNSARGCNLFNQAKLKLEYDPRDNPGLAKGWYNGVMELKFVTPDEEKKILVSISLKS